jgi:hypothetical protein
VGANVGGGGAVSVGDGPPHRGVGRDAKGRRKNCRKDHGAWYFVADLGFGPDGKRKQGRKGGFRTADDAETALAELLARSARARTPTTRGRPSPSGSPHGWS